jgi:hypothetical protein
MLAAGTSNAAAEEPSPTVQVEGAASPEPAVAADQPESAPGPAAPASSSTGPSTEGVAPFGLQLDARLGLGELAVTNGYGSPIVGGVTTPLRLSAGVRVMRALVVFGELSDDHMLLFNSGVSYDGSRFDLFGAGLGLKWYLTPGLFLSGSGSIARLRLEHRASGTETSRLGVMARASAGKEWPVSSECSVGVGGEFQFGAIQSRGLDPGLADPSEGRYAPKGLSLFVLVSFHPPAAAASGSAEVAGAPAIPPGRHAHDGLFLNASVGPAWLWARSRLAAALPEAPETKWSGRGTSLGLSIGYAVTDRLVVFGAFAETQLRDPAGESGLAAVEWSGFGPGLRYYLMPANVFLSGSFLFSKLARYAAFTSEGGSSEWISGWGGTGQVSIGKEWWVLNDVGIGVGAEFSSGKMAGNDGWLTYRVTDLSVVASITFN